MAGWHPSVHARPSPSARRLTMALFGSFTGRPVPHLPPMRFPVSSELNKTPKLTVFSGPEICIHRHIPKTPFLSPFPPQPLFSTTTTPANTTTSDENPSKRHRRRIECISKSRSSCSANSEHLPRPVRLTPSRPRERIFDLQGAAATLLGPGRAGGPPTVVIVRLFGPLVSPAARAWRSEPPTVPLQSLHSAVRAKPLSPPARFWLAA